MKDFSKRLDAISTKIKLTEETLTKNCCYAEASYEDLDWGPEQFEDGTTGSKWRIFVTSLNTPLLEVKVPVKIKNSKHLPNLVIAVEEAMEKLLSENE